MLTAVRMKVLVLFLLGVLGCSLAGARIVSKCELREQLLLAITNLTDKVKQSGVAGEDVVAKIVCYAGMASNFNTSAVRDLSQEKGGHHSQETQSGPHGGSASEKGQQTTTQPPVRGRRHSRQSHSSEENDDWTLYGLFQLCDGLICSDGVTNSLNMCGIDCLKLTDDDITDDINCVLKLFTDLVNNGFGSEHWRELSKIFKAILQEDCRNIQTSTYFSQCQ